MKPNNREMISVILPVYNSEKYLEEAVNSILNQSYPYFELICLNDGSNDNSLNILKSLEKKDNRIILTSSKNVGLVKTLNKGLKMAKYQFIARMDADDISDVDRFKKQIEFLSVNVDIGGVGCAYAYIDEQGNEIGKRFPPTCDFLLFGSLIFGSPFCHPSMMFNTKVLGGDLYYDSQYLYAEDYELWIRLLKFYKLKNLPDRLFQYRIVSTSVSRKHNAQQIESKKRVVIKLIKKKYHKRFLASSFYSSNSFFDKLIPLFFQKNYRYILLQMGFILYIKINLIFRRS